MTLRVIPCDHCDGTGWVTLVASDSGTKRMVMCGSCMSSGHVQVDETRPGVIEQPLGPVFRMGDVE